MPLAAKFNNCCVQDFSHFRINHCTEKCRKRKEKLVVWSEEVRITDAFPCLNQHYTLLCSTGSTVGVEIVRGDVSEG